MTAGRWSGEMGLATLVIYTSEWSKEKEKKEREKIVEGKTDPPIMSRVRNREERKKGVRLSSPG